MGETHFINVDLEIRSAMDLSDLAKAFEPGAFALSCMPLDDGFLANLELASQPREAESGIVGFLGLVDALPADARRMWDAATRRDFSIGIESGTTRAFEFAITHATLARVAAVGARLTFVIYREDTDSRDDVGAS